MATRSLSSFERDSLALVAPAPGDAVVWDERWGKCLGGRIFILAALVVDVEITLPDASKLAQAAAELGHAIQAEMPRAVACLNIHVVPGLSQAGNKQLRLAMSGDAELCRGWFERRQLQGSKYLGDGAMAHFRSFRDTSGAEHQQKVHELISLHSAESGFLLDLPSAWVRWPQGVESVPLQAGSLWYDFAAVWGPVKDASLVRARDPAVVHLLLDFASRSHAAKCLFELLTDRYVYYPEGQDPTYPVRCSLGHFQDLRLQVAPNVEEGAPGIFELRRLRGEALKTPQLIRVTPQRRVKLGRGEDSADIALQMAHISKVHAVLEILGGKLFIQDTSVNGTWVNDRRVANGSRVELRPQDKVSFLPNHTRDAPTYEVARSGSIVDVVVDVEPGPPRSLPAPDRQKDRQKDRPKPRHRAEPPAPKKKAQRRAQMLAEPVAVPGPRKRGRHGVVHLDGEAPDEPEELEAEEDIVALDDDALDEDVATWARGLDNGSLVGYIPALTSLFKSVSQIYTRYAGSNVLLNDFFDVVGVTDNDHRLAFATALRALSRHREG